MANKKRNKYPQQSKVLSDARRYVIKNGEYNGGSSSSDFMVTGHSTGSPYSEMEELSEQVTRAARGFGYQEPVYADDQGETGYALEQGQGLGDLGGPVLYGDRYNPPKPRSRSLMLAATFGLAATAILGGLAYYFSQVEKHPAQRPRRRKAKSIAPALRAKKMRARKSSRTMSAR